MMKIRNLLISLYLLLLAIPLRVFAVDQTIQNAQNQLNCLDWSLGRDVAGCDATTGPITGTNATNGTTAIYSVLNDIIDRLPFYLTALAFFAFLFSSGMYIFAMGDATKMETAKKNMTWTAIGMIAMVLVSIIIRFAAYISTATGHITDINQVPGIGI